MKKLSVIFAGGGTGGHLYPALAIAERLKARAERQRLCDFRFVGTRRGLEYRMRERLGYPLHLISVRGLYRTGILRNIIFPVLLTGATLKSIYLIIRFHPDVIVGTGGYVMGPVVMAAIALNKYCVLQEQNSYPGLTTRQLAHKVDKVFLGFGVAAKYLHKNCTIVETGNPIKDVIGKISRNEAREYFGLSEKDRVILILGGSQGASSINENILRNLSTLPADYKLIWQTGERDYKEVAAKAGGKVTGRALFTFTDKIELAYAAADIAIARAGALTLAELEAAGLPAILVPYPYATADHQRKNAEYFVESCAAVLFDDGRLDKVDLLNESIKLFESGQYAILAKAVDSMRRKRKKPAADMIVDEILSLIGYEGSPN